MKPSTPPPCAPACGSGRHAKTLTGLPSSTVGHAVARLLAEGRIVETAAPDEFFRAPRTERAQAFLGQILA